MQGKGPGSLGTPGGDMWGPHTGDPRITGVVGRLWRGAAAVGQWSCLQGVPPCWDMGIAQAPPREPLPSRTQAVAAAMLLGGCASPRNPAAAVAVCLKAPQALQRRGRIGWVGACGH